MAEVVELVWKRFTEKPTLASYQRLRRRTSEAGQCDEHRPRARPCSRRRRRPGPRRWPVGRHPSTGTRHLRHMATTSRRSASSTSSTMAATARSCWGLTGGEPGRRREPETPPSVCSCTASSAGDRYLSTRWRRRLDPVDRFASRSLLRCPRSEATVDVDLPEPV